VQRLPACARVLLLARAFQVGEQREQLFVLIAQDRDQSGTIAAQESQKLPCRRGMRNAGIALAEQPLEYAEHPQTPISIRTRCRPLRGRRIVFSRLHTNAIWFMKPITRGRLSDERLQRGSGWCVEL
jgi:hypothetical protein